MGRARAVKMTLVVLGSAAVGAVLAVAAGLTQGSVTQSSDAEKAFEVRLVRGPFAMEDVKGVAAIQEATGCYAAWNDKRVEVYRVGWSDKETFDCAAVWGQDFRDVRGVVPVGDGTTCFVVYTKLGHYVFKADWFRRY